jgi:hypothetical protein
VTLFCARHEGIRAMDMQLLLFLMVTLDGGELSVSCFSCFIPKKVCACESVKQFRYTPEQAQRVDRGVALNIHDLGTRMGCVVSIC